MVQVQIGSRRYDAVKVQSCHTCTHPARMLIEEKLIQNYSYRVIAEMFSEKMMVLKEGDDPIWLPKVGYMSIGGHYTKGHMPLEAASMRRIADKRAQRISEHVMEDGDDPFVDQFVLAEAVVARTHQRLVKGEIEPEVRDGLAAAKFLQQIEDETENGVTAEAWAQAMTVYFETARRIMPIGMWQEFTHALTGNPILRAIERKLAPKDPDAIDVEYDVTGDI